MITSIKARIIFGLGVIMALLVAATIVNVTQEMGIGSDFN